MSWANINMASTSGLVTAVFAVGTAMSSPVYMPALQDLNLPQRLKNGLTHAHMEHLNTGAKKLGTAPGPGQTYHSGLYVNDCYDITGAIGNDPRPFSETATYYFDDEGAYANFNIDYTMYVNDANCNPSASDVFIKIFLQGRAYWNTIPDLPNERGASYNFSNATFLIAPSVNQADLDYLNENCGQGCRDAHNRPIRWASNTLITFTEGSCSHSLPPANPQDDPRLEICRYAHGETLYNAFQYHKGYFVQSEGAFDNKLAGQHNPVNQSIHVTYVEPSKNRNPQECPFVFGSCQTYVETAAQVCDTCDRLSPGSPPYDNNYYECDGCVYRQAQKKSDFAKCCPCFYYSSGNLKAPFFGHLDC